MISNERWTASTQGQCITRGRICVRNTHDPNSCFFITCLFVLHDDPNSHWRPHVQITVCVCICYKLHRHTCTRPDNSLFNIDVPQSPQGFWFVARSIHLDGYLRCCRQNRQKQFLFASTNILNILKLIMNQLKTKQQQQTKTSTVSMYVTNTY